MKKTIRLVALFLVICMTGMFLIACVPSSIDAAKEKMVKSGYSVSDYTDNDSEGFVGGIYAYKGLFIAPDSSLTALLFQTEEDAVDAANNLSFTSPTLDGKWIYYGDEDAVKAFTKMF